MKTERKGKGTGRKKKKRKLDEDEEEDVDSPGGKYVRVKEEVGSPVGPERQKAVKSEDGDAKRRNKDRSKRDREKSSKVENNIGKCTDDDRGGQQQTVVDLILGVPPHISCLLCQFCKISTCPFTIG